MTKKLVWRLGKLPTSDELIALVKEKIITQEEAKECLFTQETQEDRDKESLKSEIKFLRELVEKLSFRTQIVEVIKEIKIPYYQQPWCQPYITWCQNTAQNLSLGGSSLNAQYKLNTVGGTNAGTSASSTGTSASSMGGQIVNQSFSSINTF